MKKLSILAPAALCGVLLSAMVLAAPVAGVQKANAASTPDRAAAYLIATAN